VRDQDRLGALEVRVAGHDGLALRLGNGQERVGPLPQTGRGVVDRLAHEEAHVRGDLLVARAAGVELQC
jgi:hypothetical protein